MTSNMLKTRAKACIALDCASNANLLIPAQFHPMTPSAILLPLRPSTIDILRPITPSSPTVSLIGWSLSSVADAALCEPLRRTRLFNSSLYSAGIESRVNDGIRSPSRLQLSISTLRFSWAQAGHSLYFQPARLEVLV